MTDTELNTNRKLRIEIESLRQRLYYYQPTEFSPEGVTWEQRVKELEDALIEARSSIDNWLADNGSKVANLEAELAALKAGQGEPVAYLVYSPTRHEQEFLYEDELGYEEGSEITPLYTSAPTIPEGWQLVPIDPTYHMLHCGDKFMDGISELRNAWEAMLAAAPKPEDVK